MKNYITVLTVLFLLALPVAAQNPSAVKLPDSQAGQRVAAYFKAFNSGDDSVMRDYIMNNMAPETLERRPIDDRLRAFRQVRDDTGSIEIEGVAEVKDSAITVLVKSEKGGRFSLIIDFQPQPPNKILGLRVQAGTSPSDNAARRESSSPSGTEPELIAALDQHLDQLVKADEFSGTVLLAKNGKAVFQKAYGLASKEYNVPNRIDTRFNLGSINKIFTQVAIAQLAESGKLTLDDPIIKLLPDYPNRQAAEKITIRQLLDHKSGIGDYVNEKFSATPKDNFRRIADFLPLFAAEPLAFEPGTNNQYSNGGYIVLGAIIEKVSGQDYYTYVREHVFKPAGMENTEYYEADAVVPNVATGYTLRSKAGGDARRNNIYLRPGRGSSAGGGYSTTDDLLKFTIALRNRKLIANRENFGMMAGDGLGIAGGAEGINAVMEVDPASGYTIIAMSNYDPPSAINIGKKVRELLRGLKR